MVCLSVLCCSQIARLLAPLKEDRVCLETVSGEVCVFSVNSGDFDKQCDGLSSYEVTVILSYVAFVSFYLLFIVVV